MTMDLPDDLVFALERTQVGFAAIDAALTVRERSGALADWLPEIGRPSCESGLLFAMEPVLEELRKAGAAPLVLPSVGLPDSEADRVNVSIAWNPDSFRYVVVVGRDEGAKQLDRLLFQQRRERQLLQQQAAAAADRLRVSTTLYRDIVESTDDAVLRLGPDLALTFFSGPAAALVGLNESAIGRGAREILPLPTQDNPWRADMCAQGPASFEQPVRLADGGTRWLWWNVRWLGDEGGPREFQAAGRDVTELRRLRAELERANEEAKFAALAQERLRISHDLHDTFIHTLVNTLARLTLLRRSAPEGALKEELLEAENEARSGLRAAREAVGAIRVEFEFAEGWERPLREAATNLARKIEVELDIQSDGVALMGPRAVALLRVAREALRNIERHSGARRARIAVRRAEDQVELTIADDGIGFDPRRPPSGHYGVVGMFEQAKLAGGHLDIASPPGGGVALTLRVPAT